ncbi:MAG: DUF4931 domain-containing protein [Veillonella sp.]|nr:DUF4931 domain-containing protein [Veillonella sp.]
MKEPLIFDIAMGRTKPFNMKNETIRCPFCDTSKLTDILDRDGHIIWLMNKFPVLRDTWPTVIIETEGDEGELSTLPIDEATRIIDFGRAKWRETMSSKEFTSVLFFKNHGPMSGGSLRHPHSQIIGLKNYDYHQDITPNHMKGWLLHEDQNVYITLSTHPIIGFFEYNLRYKPTAPSRAITLRLQQTIRFVLHNLAQFSQSYNYFFYDLNDGYEYIKVVPRYVAPPLYVGYQITQTCDDERAAQILKDITPFFELTT